MNLNKLAEVITALEEKKISISVAQVKEVLACQGKILRELDPAEVALTQAAILRKAGKRQLDRDAVLFAHIKALGKEMRKEK